MKAKLALISISISTLVACHGDGDVESFVNEGRVCLDAEDVVQFEAGGTLTLTYTASACISACPRFEEASCDAEVSGDRIIVRSEARWAPSDQICIAVCRALQAECVVSVPEEGEYTLVHGSDQLSLVLPSMVEDPPCTTPSAET
jgi:hypothetical protein